MPIGDPNPFLCPDIRFYPYRPTPTFEWTPPSPGALVAADANRFRLLQPVRAGSRCGNIVAIHAINGDVELLVRFAPGDEALFYGSTMRWNLSEWQTP